MTYDRRLLLLGPKRNDELALWEVERYGMDGFGDQDYVSLYGLVPRDWFARGVRILGRTAVECTRDRLAHQIAADVAARARDFEPTRPSIVIDLFAGSANTLYWLWRALSPGRALGFELDDRVHATTLRNLASLGLDVEVQHVDFAAGLGAIHLSTNDVAVVFVAPPWGDALSPSGLDLRRTQPPISEILELLKQEFPEQRVLVAIQTYEIVEGASLADVTHCLAAWTLTTYEINAHGQKHGLLLGELRSR